MMNTDLHVTIAQELESARVSRNAVAPLSERWPEMSVADAYVIQQLGLQQRLTGGARLRGRKIGLTARPMQKQLGVDQPDYGYLLDDMVFSDGATLAADTWIAPRVEPELAFIMGRRLEGPGVTAADVLRATEFVLPALELIDSRIANWKIKLVDTIADNASSAAVILGGNPILPSAVNLRHVPTVFSKNGEIVETGVGAVNTKDAALLTELVVVERVCGEHDGPAARAVTGAHIGTANANVAPLFTILSWWASTTG